MEPDAKVIFPVGQLLHTSESQKDPVPGKILVLAIVVHVVLVTVQIIDRELLHEPIPTTLTFAPATVMSSLDFIGSLVGETLHPEQSVVCLTHDVSEEELVFSTVPARV